MRVRRRFPRPPRDGTMALAGKHAFVTGDGRGLCDSGGLAGDDRARFWPHRQRGVDRGSQRLCLCQRLLRGQTRARRLDAGARRRDRSERRHRQRGLPGLYRHRARARQHRARRRQDRPRASGRARRISKGRPDRPPDPAGGSRRRRGVPLLAGGRRGHRHNARDRRRGDLMDQRTTPLDAETKVAERPHDHKDELRLWLRLFACKEVIEGEVRRRLRDSFDVTLPRFDLMAQLYRAPKAMTLGELSQRMMVSNGNVTGLVDRLLEQGLVSRRPSPKDRRAQLVSLTAEGRRFFRAMARANGDWIADILADLSAEEIETLMRLLAKTKASARKAIGNGVPR